jgi:hypothetical protein
MRLAWHFASRFAPYFPWHCRIEAALPRGALAQYFSFCTLNDQSPRRSYPSAEVPPSLVGGRKITRQVLPSAHQYWQKISSIPNISALKVFGTGKSRLGTIVA